MKKLFSMALSLFFAANCGSREQSKNSSTKDHAVGISSSHIFVIFENPDNNKVFLSKCTFAELVLLEKVYKDNPNNTWNASKSNPCHKEMPRSVGLSKSVYLTKLWDMINLGAAAEARINKNIDDLLAEINKQINEFNEFERQRINRLDEIDRLAKQLDQDILIKKQEQRTAQEVINYLLDKLSKVEAVDTETIANLKSSIEIYKSKISAYDAEVTSIQLRISILRDSDTTTVRQLLEEARSNLTKAKQRLVETTASREIELNKLRDRKKLIEEALKPAKIEHLALQADIATSVLEKIFLANPTLISEDVRINSSGLLELFHQNEWRGVCDDAFRETAGMVACRQMGGTYRSHTVSNSGPSGSFWVDFGDSDDLAAGCKGNETSLLQCQMRPIGLENCESHEWVKLNCDLNGSPSPISEPTPITTSTPGQLRLTPSGLLEIFHSNEWGAVCDDSFHREEGIVACRQLGGSYHSHTRGMTGGTKFWLDFGESDSSIGCNGNETALKNCQYTGFIGNTDCKQGESVKLKCDF